MHFIILALCHSFNPPFNTYLLHVTKERYRCWGFANWTRSCSHEVRTGNQAVTTEGKSWGGSTHGGQRAQTGQSETASYHSDGVPRLVLPGSRDHVSNFQSLNTPVISKLITF